MRSSHSRPGSGQSGPSASGDRVNSRALIAPLRRCVACRRVAPRSDLLRLVRQYDTGEIRLERGMGRSAYLCPTKRCFQAACKKKRLQYALRTPVSNDLLVSLLATIEAAEVEADKS
ncbi:MAG: YlxR family protein [Cyanobacteria bacterium P01_A01_bin.3]